MLTSPRIDHDLVRRVQAIRRRPGWSNPLEAVNGKRLLDAEGGGR